MIDRQSIPRRALDLEDYADIVRRNFRWLIAPAFAGLVISTVVAFALQNTYVSDALIRVVPQQISTELVHPVSAQDVADRVNAMVQSLESRNTLTNIITTYGLYKSEVKHEPFEDVISQMQKSIGIRPMTGLTSGTERELPAIQISFSYSDRYMAQKVCQNLVSRLMDASTEASSQTEVSVNQFLRDEFDQAKRDLDTIEQKLSDFRQKNAGHLPEETQTNISQMNALETRMSSLSEAATHNAEQRMMLESELRLAKDRLAAIQTNSPQSLAHNEHVMELNRQIEQLETNIASMRDRYTEDYPGLQSAKSQLAVLKKQRDQALKDDAAAPPLIPVDTSTINRERVDAQGQIDQLQVALKSNAMEAQQIQKQSGQVNAGLKSIQDRLEAVPAGEKEYADLNRDEALARERYIESESKVGKSAVSMDLERRRQGQTVEQLDQASLPEQPTAPRRTLIIPAGPVIGLVLGFVFVTVREVRDTTLKNLKDARLYTQLSILGSVPLLENDVVVQRRRQMMWVSWAAATFVGLAIIAGSVAHYLLKKA
ncbi:MAG: hypothetical protein JOY54_16910 [Acidobacteriaceae bacterium]|nr:hypothetical protein [Acidobacteriaceae bacterium]